MGAAKVDMAYPMYLGRAKYTGMSRNIQLFEKRWGWLLNYQF